MRHSNQREQLNTAPDSLAENIKRDRPGSKEKDKGRNEGIPKLDSELLTLNTNEEELHRYIARIKQAGPDEKFPIFHGTRGGFYEIASILQSEEKGVKGGEVGGSPTYALYPSGAYWIQPESAGFKYTFERKYIKFPGEPESPDTIITIDERGLAFIKKGLGHLSLVDFEGEVMFGPHAEAPPEIVEGIRREFLHLQAIAREVRPVMKVINGRLRSFLEFPADENLDKDPYVKSLREKLFSIFPLTYERYQNKSYEQKLSVIEEYATRYLEEVKKSLHQVEKRLEALKDEGVALDMVTRKASSRSALLWHSKTLTRRFLEKHATGRIRESILDAIERPMRGGERAKEVTSRLESLKIVSESRQDLEEGDRKKLQGEIAHYTRVLAAISKIRDTAVFYEKVFASKTLGFHEQESLRSETE